MGGKGENVAFVINDMKRYAKVVGQRAPSCDVTEEAEDRESDVTVHPGDGTYLPHTSLPVLSCPEYLKGVALQGMGQLLGPQMDVLEGEDVDIDPALLEYLVVGTGFFEQGMTVAQLGKQKEVVLVGIVGLQGDVLRQFTGQHLHQAQVVVVEQAHVKVIVPGDETVVANGTQQRASIKEIGNVVFATDAIELDDHFKHLGLLFLQ